MFKTTLCLALLMTFTACGNNAPNNPNAQDALSSSGRWKATRISCKGDNLLPDKLELDLKNGHFALVGEITDALEASVACRRAVAFLRNASDFESSTTQISERGTLTHGKERTVCTHRSEGAETQESDMSTPRPLELMHYSLHLDPRTQILEVEVDGLFECTDLSLTLRRL
jgi:hypothetical protein